MSAARLERLEIQLIALDNIRVDYELQSRAAMHKEYEREFMQAMLRGDSFPPVQVFWDGTCYWLADGFHRYGAARAARIIDIRCEIHYGTRRDAIIYSAGCNKEFSIKRSEEDKRKAASMLFADEEWFNKSADLIAKHIGVTGSTITIWRVRWCEERGRRPPKRVVTARGTTQVATPRKPGSVWRGKDGKFYVLIDGKEVELHATEGDATGSARIPNIIQARRVAREMIRAMREADPDLILPPVRGADEFDAQDAVEYLVARGVLAFLKKERDDAEICEHIAVYPRRTVDAADAGPAAAIVVLLTSYRSMWSSDRTMPDLIGQLAVIQHLTMIDDPDAPDAPELIIAMPKDAQREPRYREIYRITRERRFPIRFGVATLRQVADRFGSPEST